jgi:hypothetical protein
VPLEVGPWLPLALEISLLLPLLPRLFVVFYVENIGVHREQYDGVYKGDEPDQWEPKKDGVQNAKPHLPQVEPVYAHPPKEQGQYSRYVFIFHSKIFCQHEGIPTKGI